MQMLGHLLKHPRITANQNRRQTSYDIGQARGTKAFIEFRPTDYSLVGIDLQEGKHAPASIGLKGLDLCDFHPFAPDLDVSGGQYLARSAGAKQGSVPGPFAGTPIDADGAPPPLSLSLGSGKPH
jgi:hypothetical protein